MAVFNTFTFDGENSLDYGVYITGEAVYNAPERAIEMVSIPGKNGALALDQGRFENIEVTYPAGMFGVKQAEFAGRMRAMRNMLASRYNYVRLTDSYHPDEYRLGLYKSGLEAAPVAMSSAGEFDITFNCKPQRFLTSGEEPVDTSELGGDVTTDKVPYLFRRSGGGNIGHDFDAEIDKLVGGTVAWNQLVQLRASFVSPAGITVTNNGDGSATLNGTASSSGNITLIAQPISIAPNHVYYGAVGSSLPQGSYLTFGGSVVTGQSSGVWKNSSFTATYFRIDHNNGVVFDNVKIVPLSVDLTALFGSAEIADYVYSLEQTTSGSGIAWLKSHGFLTKDYYAYDSGSLKSVKTSAHVTTGFNQWDEEWRLGLYNTTTGVYNYVDSRICSKNMCRCVPNTTYYLLINKSGYTDGLYYSWYDSDKNYISRNAVGSNGICTSPSNAYYFNISLYSAYGTTYNHDICINSKNGQYEPYIAHTYPLDSDLELRGLFKLDANNNLYAEGDIYPPSGEVDRKYGIYTFTGSETWIAYGSGYRAVVLTNAKYKSIDGEIVPDNVISNTGLPPVSRNSISTGGVGLSLTGDTILVSDTSGLTGKSLVYELATPTTETADPYANSQIVNPLGTEEYIDTRDVPVPVGHETRYGMSQLVLTNPTEFPSKPLLEVTGVGTFWLGDTLFTITGTAGQTIYIDCETGEAWKNVGGTITPANGLVTLNRLDFPELDPGDTPVMYGTGITKVVVTPRWWII